MVSVRHNVGMALAVFSLLLGGTGCVADAVARGERLLERGDPVGAEMVLSAEQPNLRHGTLREQARSALVLGEALWEVGDVRAARRHFRRADELDRAQSGVLETEERLRLAADLSRAFGVTPAVDLPARAATTAAR